MTHFVASPAAIRPQATSRVARSRGVACGALIAAFGLFAGFPTPAAAACTQPAAPHGSGTFGSDRTYICQIACLVVGATAPRLRSLTLRRDRRASCLDWCNVTAGCVAVSVEYYYEMIDGLRVPMEYCTLYGAGAMSTENVGVRPERPLPRGYHHSVCVRVPAPPRTDTWRDGIGTDRFYQDQYRPGVPGPGVPNAPKRP